MQRIIHRSSQFINNFFQIPEQHSSIKTESLAGFTTFLTMAYIILVNPAILSSTGMNPGATFVATCLAAAIGSFLTGVMSNYPVAVAPSMALNIYFAYIVVGSLGYSWQTALGAVFISGVLFFILTITSIKKWIINAVPQSLNIAIAVGIGLFIALIALKTGGIIVAEPHTMMTLGKITSLPTLLFLFGFCLIVVLDRKKVPGAMIIGIIATSIIGISLGISQFHGVFSMPPSLSDTFMKINVKDTLHQEGYAIIFSFFLVALFDTTGTLLGLLQQTKLHNDERRVKRLSNALLANSVTTIAGSLMGTSTTSPYIESAAGVRAGGKTGLTPVIVSLLFLLALFLSPLASTIPSYATAPALLFVAVLMIQHITHIHWDDTTESIPSVITALMIPFSFSIADGIGLGFICYVVIKLLAGKWRELNPILVLLALVFVLYFVFRP